MCRWTFLFLQCVKVHLSQNRPQISVKKQKKKQRNNFDEEIIIQCIYVGLWSVMWQKNKSFHWTFLTVTNTHFNRLQIIGWTRILQHTFKKLLLSIWHVFVLVCFFILMVIETIHWISLGKEEEGRTHFSFLRWRCPLVPVCVCFFLFF